MTTSAPCVRPAPAPSIALPMKGWSVMASIGMTSSGRSWASATMVVAWPPCPTTTETSGITSVWASQECSSTLAGTRSRRRVDRGPGGGDHARLQRSHRVENPLPRRLEALERERAQAHQHRRLRRGGGDAGHDRSRCGRRRRGRSPGRGWWPPWSARLRRAAPEPSSRAAGACSPNGPFAIPRQQVSKECSRAT